MNPDETKHTPAKKKRSRVRWLLLTAGGVLALCAVLGGLTVLMMWKAPAEQVQET